MRAARGGRGRQGGSGGRGVAVAIAIAMAVVGAIGGLTACTGSGSSPEPSASASGPTSSAPLPSSSSIANDPDARKDIKATGCVATSSGWKASGTATNSGSKDTTYTIVISFTTQQSTVLARGTTEVTVKAGATKKWSAEASFAKTKGVQCVLRGVSTT